MTTFKDIVLLDEMVGSYRASHLSNFTASDPVSLLPKSSLSSATDDEADDLFSLVQSSKKAPGSTSIAAVDTTGLAASDGKPTEEALAIYNDMLTLSSLANVVAMKGVYKDHPEKFDITNPKEASKFVQAKVVNLNDTFTRRLGAYAIPGETTAQYYEKQVTSASLHTELLLQLFGSFNFSPASLKKLDGILTQITESLKNLKISFESETQTLDHLIFTNYIEAMDIQGLSEKVLVGKIRLFYIKLNQESWKIAIGKSSANKFMFTMNYFDTIFTINSQLVRGDITNIRGLIEKFTNHSFEEVSKLTSPTAISK
jgi:hypothetical protein